MCVCDEIVNIEKHNITIICTYKCKDVCVVMKCKHRKTLYYNYLYV